MPTYVTLIEFTGQGISNIKDSPARLAKAKELLKQTGGKMNAFYLTMGGYDAVAISEAPDDEAYARFTLAVCAQGNVRTETLRAFTEDEYRKLISSLP